jgi:hypothetical protein
MKNFLDFADDVGRMALSRAKVFVAALTVTLLVLGGLHLHRPREAVAQTPLSTALQSGLYGASGSAAGTMSAAHFTKLNALPDNATLNATYATQTALAAVEHYHYQWGAPDAAAATATRWPAIWGSTVAYTATSPGRQAFTAAPVAMTCVRLWAKHTLGGLSTDTVTFELEKNAVATGATVVITAGSTALFTSAINVSFAAGDQISMRSTQSGTTAGAAIHPRVGSDCKSP